MHASSFCRLLYDGKGGGNSRLYSLRIGTEKCQRPDGNRRILEGRAELDSTVAHAIRSTAVRHRCF